MSQVADGPGRTVLVTGGAGFVGSALVRRLVQESPHRVVTVDALTYAGDLRTLEDVAEHPRHAFERVDVCDGPALERVFERHRPDAVLHLAAESHVDRSIDAPAAFVRTNVLGTATLLDVVRDWLGSGEGQASPVADDDEGPSDGFRFVHVSTDEVYGDLPYRDTGAGSATSFTESTPYDPHSPYAASKAASDHFVRAWAHTYGLPVIVTHGTNTYGPWQFPEKLIPVVALRAMADEPIPLYGTGENVRDWIHVDDHASALHAVLERGIPGETYDIGARCERTNLEVVRAVCRSLDELRPRIDGQLHEDRVESVDDRPGHDRRYATDPSKIERELGWRPRVEWDSGLRRTVEWMVGRRAWMLERAERSEQLRSARDATRSGDGVVPG
ncbi:MAG: dTDP-glucose 4,6-dehydratase [Gemmatimonadetes bacterium]|nr:dTDP-glucose 4,6-dehydratase [Gemmatimonadota bacterium]